MFYLILLLSVTFILIYYFYKQKFSYWRRQGIPYLEPSIPFGNLKNLRDVPPLAQFAERYKDFRDRGEKYGGIFFAWAPIFIPVDPECIKDILLRDFQQFRDRGMYINKNDRPLLINLLSLGGDRWRNLRTRLSPVFTTAKIKMLFETIMNCAYPLGNEIERLTAKGDIIELKVPLEKFATDVIVSCCFGIDCNSFETPNSEFQTYGQKIFDENVFKSFLRSLAFTAPKIAEKLGITIIDNDVKQFFEKVIIETYNFRIKNNIYRSDIMQFFIELGEKKENPLTMDEVTANLAAFFVAGFDSSSSALNFCLFELAFNLDIQDKLRKEIQTVLQAYNGQISYEALKEMKYMEQVIKESLRKYPPFIFIIRMCTENCKLTSSNVVIEKGTRIIITPLGVHRDPIFYPNPEKFDPDRFSDENNDKIISGTYLPFGDGPRACIGMQFALMQVKICLIMLIKDFEFTVNPKTKVPLEIDFNLTLAAKGGIWLNSKKVS